MARYMKVEVNLELSKQPGDETIANLKAVARGLGNRRDSIRIKTQRTDDDGFITRISFKMERNSQYKVVDGIFRRFQMIPMEGYRDMSVRFPK